MRAPGLRDSPFTPERMGLRLRLEDVQWLDDETLVWLEGRPDRGALVVQTGSDAARDLDSEVSVRAGVGYGGGDFTVSPRGVLYVPRSGAVTLRPWKDARAPKVLHPSFGGAASPQMSPDGQWVLFVHTFNGTDLLACVDSRGARWPVDLSRGADFYMQPVWHPSGGRVAWVEWDHPQMPWDGARLMLADFDALVPGLTGIRAIAGSEDVPVFQPAFSPDGRSLAWLEGVSDDDALVLLDLETGERRELIREVGLLPPAWVQGMRSFGWHPDSRRLVVIRNVRGVQSLVRVEIDGRVTEIDAGPYTAFSQVSVSPGGRIAAIASASDVPERVVRQDGGQWVVVRRGDPEDVPRELLPAVTPVDWTSSDGEVVHGLYFAPLGLKDGELPPLLVNVHGGPTAQRLAAWTADTAFFTTRGWAVLEVNHRGSTGYGRRYQQALEGRWGILDAQDAAEGAQAMAAASRCDRGRMVIKGGSAGGFTVLRLLTQRPGVFRAGVCLYGVSDLTALVEGTHKFEERYLDRLVGPLPQTLATYHERSPLRSVQNIHDPLALFQGADDRVVPPDQSERIAQALSERGIPHLFRLYEGEGHGWRKSETIAAYYREMEHFLRTQVLA